MTIERVDAYIPDDSSVTLTDMGHVVEAQYMARKNHSAHIKKLSKDTYLDLATGEIKDFKQSENRGQNVNSLRQTFKKLGYLVNANFHGNKNELWTTLTYQENEQDLRKVAADFDKFLKRLQTYCRRSFPLKVVLGKKSGPSKKRTTKHIPQYHFEFLKVLEPQERGAWHIHLLLKFPYKQKVFLPKQDFAKLWGHGFVDIQEMRSVDNLGAYLTAYLANLEVIPPDYWNEADEKYYRYLSRETGAKEIESPKSRPDKAVLKGGRLHMYPVGMNIYSSSRGIRFPERRTITYRDIFRKLKFKLENLTLRKSIRIANEAYDFENTIIIEQYNKRVTNFQSNLYQIQFLKTILKQPSTAEHAEWSRPMHEKELYELEHRFELLKLTQAFKKAKQV